MGWQAAVTAWLGKRHAPELADDVIQFFGKTFQTPLKLYPHDAWFGVHSNCVSLTIGNMWLAALASPPNCVYLMVEHDLNIPRTGYLPIRSTFRYVPLGLVTVKPWDNIAALNRERSAWESYSRACELILHSPISRNVITRNLRNKSRLGELVLRGK